MTIIGHIAKKVPEQEDVGACYGILCEVAHPNMLGRSLFLSKQDGMTIYLTKARAFRDGYRTCFSPRSVVGGRHIAAITHSDAGDLR